MTSTEAIKELQEMEARYAGAEMFMETAPLGPNDTSDIIKRKTAGVMAFTGLEGLDPDGNTQFGIVAVSLKTLMALVPRGTPAGEVVKVAVPKKTGPGPGKAGQA